MNVFLKVTQSLIFPENLGIQSLVPYLNLSTKKEKEKKNSVISIRNCFVK